ncbi:MAG: hypothetical protein ACE5M4_15635 [Anaerolineales bacterium]
MNRLIFVPIVLLMYASGASAQSQDIPLLAATIRFPVDTSCGSVAIADPNRDIQSDIIVANKRRNRAAILLDQPPVVVPMIS